MQKRRTAVTIIRESQNLPNEHCFVLKENDQWYLVQRITEFHLDGYALIPKATVDTVRYNKFDKKLEAIIHFLGVDQMVKDAPISLGTDQALFESLMQSESILSIENESDDHERFVIGGIRKCSKRHLSFQHFDATGKWFKRNTTFPYSEMTKVHFGGEYESTWKQYMEHLGSIPS